MNKLVLKFNIYILLSFVFAPFLAMLLGKYLNVSFNRVLQLLSYVGFFSILIFRNKSVPIVFPKYLLFYLLFIIYVFFSTFILLNRPFKITYLFSYYLIGAFNVLFIIENIKIDDKHYQFIIKYSKYILIIAIIVIFYQQTMNSYFLVKMNSMDELGEINMNKNRLPSIYSWLTSLSVGFVFVPIFILVIDELLKKKERIAYWIVFGITFVVLTKARWVMVNTLLVFVLLFIYKKTRTIQVFKQLFVLPLVAILFYFALNSLGVDIEGIVKERILESDKENINRTSAGTRILAFKVFNQLYWDHPILGVGNIKYGMGGTGKHNYKLRQMLKGRSSQIHVGYLSLFYKYGLIGGFLFISFLYFLLRKLYRNAKVTGRWSPFLGFMGFILANLTLVTFSVFETGLFIVLIADKLFIKKKEIKPITNV